MLWNKIRQVFFFFSNHTTLRDDSARSISNAYISKHVGYIFQLFFTRVFCKNRASIAICESRTWITMIKSIETFDFKDRLTFHLRIEVNYNSRPLFEINHRPCGASDAYKYAYVRAREFACYYASRTISRYLKTIWCWLTLRPARYFYFLKIIKQQC